MKITKKILMFLLIIITFPSVQAQLIVDGEFRSRLQTLHGWKKPVKTNTDAILAFDQRTRIKFDYKSEKINARFTLQDARVWGADDIYNSTAIIANTGSLGVYEAWAEVKIADFSSLRIGRQEWNYDDMRILCWRNLWTTGLSYDGILYKIHNKNKDLLIDLGLSYNSDGAINGDVKTNSYPDRLKTLNFLNIKKKFNENTSLALMFAFTGKQDTSKAGDPLLVKGTHGLFFFFNHGKKPTDGFTSKISAYYQHGTDMSRIADGSAYKKVSAYLFDVQAGFRTMNKKLEITVGSELISGNDAKNTELDYKNVQHSFDLLYSGRFPYYGGNINYFINGTSGIFGTKGGGLLDPYLKIDFSPAKGKKISLTLWQPMLATNVAYTDYESNTAYYEKPLGTNIDLSYTHKFSKFVIFKILGSYAIVSDTKNHMVYGYSNSSDGSLNELGNNYSIFTMLIIKPSFYKPEINTKN